MKLNRKHKTFFVLVSLLISIQVLGQTGVSFDKYHTNGEVQKAIAAIQQLAPSKISVHKIAVSPGGEAIHVIEIGKDLKDVPAVFVGANFEGKTPLATEGALYFAKMLIDSAKYSEKIKWFILPLPNPDATAGYFSSPRWERTVNNAEVNDDVDDQANEDEPDDLNNDGYITQMRVEDPEGAYLISEKDPRIMRRADPKKGERGKYKIYQEGLDNDGDGNYNEDGPGGINAGVNFPHLFKAADKESGLWPGATEEVYGVMDFIFSHPEINMVFTLGTSDFCMAAPRGGRRGGANLESIKIPERFASRFGADPNKTYTMAEVLELFKTMMPSGGGRELSPDMIMSFLGLGAMVNPLEEDLRFYTELSEKYKEYLKKKAFPTERLAAEPDKDGSFELWAYYHLGVPSFAMNLFTVQKPVEQKPRDGALSLEEAEKMSTEEFIALGEEKIGAFLKSQNAPERMSNPARLIEMMKSGRFTPKQLTAMMKSVPQQAKSGELDEKDKVLLAYNDKNLQGAGFIKWQPFTHPTLGNVKIGGYAPFVSGTPPASQIDSLCRIQLPWLLQLSTKMAEIKVLKEEITGLGAGVFRLEIFFENRGYLPYPIAMGSRNRQPAPVLITLNGENIEFLEGFKRTPLGDIGGNQVKKLTWLVKIDKKADIEVKIESAVFGSTVKQIKIGG